MDTHSKELNECQNDSSEQGICIGGSNTANTGANLDYSAARCCSVIPLAFGDLCLFFALVLWSGAQSDYHPVCTSLL